MENTLDSIGATLVAVGFILLVGYVMIAVIIFILGMLAGFLARPALWLISKMMGLFGIQWQFRPYRRVLVIDEDAVYESREIWDGLPDDWSSFHDEWMIDTLVTAVMWPFYVLAFLSWPIRRLVTGSASAA